jgi:hypothetical protein
MTQDERIIEAAARGSSPRELATEHDMSEGAITITTGLCLAVRGLRRRAVCTSN